MHIKQTTMKRGNKTYTYAFLVQAQRVGTTIKHKTLARLGRVDNPSSPAAFLLPLLAKEKASRPPTDVRSRLFALPMAIHSLWNDLDISDVIAGSLKNGKVQTDVSLLTELMVLGRILHPDSKLSLTRWYHSLYLPVRLPASIDVHAFYRMII